MEINEKCGKKETKEYFSIGDYSIEATRTKHA